MDSILFYGETSRSDASRRQVRSAAAQHSHRIGPRKPKSSKKPKAHFEANQQNRRSLKANAFNIVTSPSSTAGAQAGKPTVASPSPAAHTQRTPVWPSHHAQPPEVSAPAAPASFESQTSRVPNVVTDREKQRKRQAAQARFQEIQAIQHAQAQAHAHAHTEHEDCDTEPRGPHPHLQQRQLHQAHTLPPTSIPAPELPLPLAPAASSPPAIEGIEQPHKAHEDVHLPTRSRAASQTSPRSPSTRLPQYSWTEYPRYGLGYNHTQTSLQMLARVAVAEREGIEAQSSPEHAPYDVPGFRHFGNDQQRQLHPTSSEPAASPQSARLHTLSHATDQTIGVDRSEPGPQLAPLAVQRLPDHSSPAATITFAQYLHSATNGHQLPGGVQHSVTGSLKDVKAHNVPPHFSPGGTG